MRRHAPLIALALLAAPVAALAAQAAPAAMRVAPSGRATSEVTLTMPRAAGTPAPATPAEPLTIRLDYGQPHLRGRALHTDSLVPYDRPWRTGANDPTTLTTGVDLVIGGQPVPKGSYAIWTIPSRAGWKLMIQRRVAPGDMQAEMTYVATNDVARIDLRRQTLSAPVESLTMWLVPATGAGPARGELRMAWGTTMVSTDWSVR